MKLDMLKYDLDLKIELSKKRIREFYSKMGKNVYVSFSGGKDSTVLLHLVRNVFPECKGTFVDTGLEFPEIRNFVKTQNNIEIVKPEKTFKQVIEKYGYPVLSKKIAMGFDRIRNTKSEEQVNLRLYGGTCPTSGKYQENTIPYRWHYLLKRDIKISDKCCYFLKKKPLKKFEKETGLKPIIGTMASESGERKKKWLKEGCNIFKKGKESCEPLSFWNDLDIWNYIKKNNLKYCKVYDMGYKRTGCVFCMFGVHKESNPNRFQCLKNTHPKLFDYCINNLGCGKVLDLIGVDYGDHLSLFD